MIWSVSFRSTPIPTAYLSGAIWGRDDCDARVVDEPQGIHSMKLLIQWRTIEREWTCCCYCCLVRRHYRRSTCSDWKDWLGWSDEDNDVGGEAEDGVHSWGGVAIARFVSLYRTVKIPFRVEIDIQFCLDMEFSCHSRVAFNNQHSILLWPVTCEFTDWIREWKAPHDWSFKGLNTHN